RATGIERALLRAGAAQDAHQPPRVDALEPDHAVPREPGPQRLVRAPVGRLARYPPRDEPRHLRRVGLLVAVMDTIVAQLGDGEGHHLARIGRVGEDFLASS